MTPGRFYVDGVLAEAEAVEGAPGHPLAAQPYLAGTAELPGLPRAGGRRPLRRRAGRLDPPRDTRRGAPAARVRARRPRHRDAGADRLAGHAARGRRRRDLRHGTRRGVPDARPADADGVARRRRRRSPTRARSPPPTATGAWRTSSTACRSTRSTRGEVTYTWSRENGSVVAGLEAIGPTAIAGMDAELTLDREGRDEELSIGEGDVVEVTSTDRVLHGAPGFLATAGAPVGLLLPIAWSAGFARRPGRARTRAGRPPLGGRAAGRERDRGPAGGRRPGRLRRRRLPHRRLLADPGAHRPARLRRDRAVGHDRMARRRSRRATAPTPARAGASPRDDRAARPHDRERDRPLDAARRLPASRSAAHGARDDRPAGRRRPGGGGRAAAARGRPRRRAQRRSRGRGRRGALRRGRGAPRQLARRRHRIPPRRTSAPTSTATRTFAGCSTPAGRRRRCSRPPCSTTPGRSVRRCTSPDGCSETGDRLPGLHVDEVVALRDREELGNDTVVDPRPAHGGHRRRARRRPGSRVGQGQARAAS